MSKPVWDTSCKDWERRIVAGESLIAFPPLFPSEAEEALNQFKQLRVVDVAGRPTFGEVCRPWILDYVQALFGAYDPAAGRRLITESLMSISKKNGKSTLAAGIMLTALIRNWRDSGEYLILAPTVEVAANSFGPARDMVRADEELSDMFHVQDHIRTITHRNTQATLKVVAADSATVSGKKGIIVLVDELHEFGKRADAEDMLREATGGLASRPEGCTIYLTTQSDQPPAGIFRQKLIYAREVRDGKVHDPAFLPLLYEFPEQMLKDKAFLDISNAYITNPNLGVSVDEAFLRRELAKAQNAGEESLRGMASKHLNVEIGLALRSDRWAGADYWEQAALPGITLDVLLERCEVVDVGIDGGGLDDLLGLAVVGRDRVSGRKLHWGHAWAHPSVLERRKAEAPRFRDFAQQGDLTLVRQIGDDVVEVTEIIRRIDAAGVLDKIGVDPYGIGAILDALMGVGITEDKIVGISQGWKMAGAIKTAERWLAEGQFGHGGAPVMSWCVGNAKVEPKGNAVSITKQSSGSAKIDPLMALLNAVSLMALNPESASSVYNDRGFVSV